VSEVGKEWASFIEKQLQAEEARRSSVVTRGGAAVASAAGLVTLVLALFAVFLGKDFQTSGVVAIALGVAVLALLASAVCGVVIVSPWKYGYSKIPSLREMTQSPGDPGRSVDDDAPSWETSEEEARRATAEANVDAIEALKSGTDTQVKWLTAAAISQLVAVAALVVATVTVLMCPESEVQQARKALEDQAGMSKLLDAVEAEGLLKTREDVVKLATYYRLSCDGLEDPTTQSPDSVRDRLMKDLNITVSVDQVKALEHARAEFCEAQ
jgi:hypothetical protein